MNGSRTTNSLKEQEEFSQSNIKAAPDRLEVPADLYGLFVAEPLQLNVHVDGYMIFFLEIYRVTFFIALNFAIQMLYIARIHHLNKVHEGGQCSHQHPFMQLVCVFVFSTSIFRELRDCTNLFTLVIRSPVKRENGYMSIGVGRASPRRQTHGAVLHAEELVTPPSLGERVLQWAKRRSSANKHHLWTLGSMSYSWKAICLLLVALPRMVICGVLTKVASGYIARSSEEHMIVDTVAALFVVDIGAFIYNAFTTNSVKQQLEKMQPLEWPASNARRLANFFFVNFVYPVVIIGFTTAMVWYLRLECDTGEDLVSAFDLHTGMQDIRSVFTWE